MGMPADISKRHCGGEGQRVLGGEAATSAPPSISNPHHRQTAVMMQDVPDGGATEGAGESPGASIPLASTANHVSQIRHPGNLLPILPPGQFVANSPTQANNCGEAACAGARRLALVHVRQMEEQLLEDAMPQVSG